MSEQELINKAKTGDKNAWDFIIKKYSEGIFKLIMSFVNHPHYAEDISQEVFIEVFSNLDKFRGKSTLETWIYRIAINKSINFANKQKRHHWLSFFTSESTNVQKKTELLNKSTDETPLHELMNVEKRKILYDAINKLPKNQRIAFTLNKVDEKSYHEIAVIMNVSISSVESLIHRAKKNLQKHLRQLF